MLSLTDFSNFVFTRSDKESAEILKVTKSDLEEKINNLEKQLKEKEVHSKKLEIKLKVSDILFIFSNLSM